MNIEPQWSKLASGPGLEDVDELQKRFGFDDDVASLLRSAYPSEMVEVGQRRFFPNLDEVLDEDELAWPQSWLPLETTDDHVTLVLAEGKVWKGFREGEADLSAEPMWESFSAFLADVAALKEHEAYDSLGEGDRWLTPEAEKALKESLSDEAFDFFGLPTLAEVRRYLEGEVGAGRIVAIAGLFFLACSVAFLVAPFGTMTIRVPFVVVIGCVPFAIFLYGSRAMRRARDKLLKLPR